MESPTTTTDATRRKDASDHASDDTGDIKRVALALQAADYVLILAGAGFSADSGLGTYETMPEEYRELCNPLRLVDDTVRFQQFWLNFAINYANCQPHEGYSILNQWFSSSSSTQDMPETKSNDNDCSNSSSSPQLQQVASLPRVKDWWVYTSNVDGHFRHFQNFQDRLCEIHGHAQEFRCPCAMGLDHSGLHPRQGDLWNDWNRQVASKNCTQTCHTDTIRVIPDGDNKNKSADELRYCNHCGLAQRPNVLMFHDTDKNVLRSIQTQRDRYQTWEAQMEDQVALSGENLVILEFGCGLNVPAVRIESEEVLGDCLERISEEAKESDENNTGSALLVRINPKDAGIENSKLQSHTISIYDTSFKAIQAINEVVVCSLD